jgi:hypothetical protein
MVRVVAKKLVYALFCLAFGLNIPRGNQGSEYVFGRDVNKWANMRDPRVRFTGFECLTDSKGGISIYHFVATALWHSVKWVSASARNSPDEANDVAMCQRRLVLPVFEESSERVYDSADLRKDVRVSFGKESVSPAPFHFGNPRRGVSLWSFVRVSRGADAGHLDTAC